MSAAASHFGSVFEPISWQAEVRARLEDRHLVAFGDDSSARARFAATMSRYLSTQPGVEVCAVHARSVSTIDDLCDQLERLVPVERLSRSIDGRDGVAALLREPGVDGVGREAGTRVFIIHDADVLMRRDRTLFDAFAEVLFGVSAELELKHEGAALLQRGVFVGSRVLADEASGDGSVFKSWLADDSGSVPFWAIVSGVSSPPVALCSIDRLVQPA